MTRRITRPMASRAVARHAIVLFRELSDSLADPAVRRSLRSCEALRNRHSGERCFLLGNGPSLRKTDLTRLRNDVVIGTNRVYLLFDELGFSTTYYVAINHLVMEQCAAEIAALPMPKFLNMASRKVAQDTPSTVFLRPVGGPRFCTDVSQGFWHGATVTFAALQVAYHLGFHEVVLLGVDHHFETKGQPHDEVVSTGDDPNHFDPRYFGSGFRWNLPDLATSELAYGIADYVFRQVGRRIVDATVDGHLRVFPRVDFDSLDF